MIFFIFSSLLLFLLQEEAQSQATDSIFRLQNDVIPKSYNLKLRPMINEGYFYGEVTIFLETEGFIENITLNSRYLKIHSVFLDNMSRESNFELIPHKDLLNIYTRNITFIDPGEHFLYINFTGRFRNDSNGFFMNNIDDKNLISVATMFSASNARMVFPCLDEPVYKSIFTVRLIKPDSSYTALSNMESIGSFEGKNGIVVDFRSTIPISPYVLCFILTKYNYSSTTYQSIDGRNISIRFFVPDQHLDEMKFFLNVTKKALNYFENYTNRTYPLDKLDFIELKDFKYVGMEHIGLVTVEHRCITFNKSVESKIVHQTEAALLVVHEIAHMWFGDLVTHLWYNDLWLTEGFAEFMEYKGLDHQYPDWQLIDIHSQLVNRFLYYEDVQRMSENAVIKFPKTHTEVEDQFKNLIYTKGADILKMLELVMGNNSFREATRNYLKEFDLGMASTSDFIKVFQKKKYDLDLSRFLQTWLYQNRYPLIIVEYDSVNESYALSQKNFFLAPDYSSIFEHKWSLPVTYSTSSNKSMQTVWFDQEAEVVRIPRHESDRWIKFNFHGKSFHRVLYPDEEYKKLFNHFEELSESDQANLIDETVHLMRKLQLSCQVPFKFIEKLKGKKSLLPVLVSLKELQYLIIDAQDETIIYKKLKNFLVRVFEDLYYKLKWQVKEDDTHSIRLLRVNLLKFMCLPPMEYENCYSDIEKLKKEKSIIHPDLYKIYGEVLANYASKISESPVSIPPIARVTRSIKFHLEMCIPWIINNL